MKVYADRLRQLLNENGLRQQDLADFLGVTQNAIHCYVSNKREPSMETQKKIADYFGVSIDYMMRTDEELSLNTSNNGFKNNMMNKFIKVD